MSSIGARFREKAYFFLLPLLIGIFPAFFHYGNNSRVVLLSSLGKLLILLVAFSLISYLLLLIIFRGQALKASIFTSVFLIFFNTYGMVYDLLRQFDRFTIAHYMFLPFYILLAIYVGWLISRLSEKRLKDAWKITTVVVGALIIFNIIKIVPAEMQKSASPTQRSIPDPAGSTIATDQTFPDIYYIVFDEMAAFDAIRQYWQYNEIDNFIAELQAKGFYVAENSFGSTDNTYHELANRMDFERYPYDPSKFQKYWDAALDHLSNNKVITFLKSMGYSTIVFDEGLPISTKIPADVVYTSSINELMSWGSIYDEFGLMVINNTMLEPFIKKIVTNNSAITDHERMLVFTADQVNNLDVPSPKFVYIHLLIPHMPFLFDAEGDRINPKHQYDWDQYLGYYIFSTQYAKSMIEKILASYDTANPPVIVFQSDHGARNRTMESGNILLENYPAEYLNHIVNTLYLPGCEDAPLTQNLDPVNTFPIIFNCYFDANLPLK